MRVTTKHIEEAYENNDAQEMNKKLHEGDERLDLNVLLKRIKQQKNQDRKVNIIVISTITLISLTVVLILSL